MAAGQEGQSYIDGVQVARHSLLGDLETGRGDVLLLKELKRVTDGVLARLGELIKLAIERAVAKVLVLPHEIITLIALKVH